MRSIAFAAPLLLAGCAGASIQPHPDAVAPPAATITPPMIVSNPAIGGTVLPTDRAIADDLATVPSLATLTRTLVTAALTDELRAPGPITVFAPSDAAWDRLQPGTLEALNKPENRAALVKLLRLHLVAGAVTGAELRRRVAAGGGHATLTALAGEPIAVTETSGVLTLTDTGGDRSYVEIADVRASNGVIHVVNGVLVPRLP